jgi:heat shock protein HtpX
MNTNTLKTAVFLALLGGLLVVGGNLIMPGKGAAIGLVLGVALAGGSYWFSDKLAIRAAAAVPVTEQQMPEYYAVVRDLTQRAGIPMPQLYVSPSPQPNAFATGRNPSHAAVAVTQGILGVLNWDELKGVLAHEISHVKNRDILISSVAAAVAMGITYVAQMGQFAAFFGGRNDDENGQNMFVTLLLLIVAPVAAALMQLALSRSREYQADLSGAELLGDGSSLATALQKIERGAQQIPMDIDPAHAQAFIINPLTGREMSFSNLFSSHPPTEERIARLRKIRASAPQ